MKARLKFAISLAAGFAGVCSPVAAADLTVVSWGGIYTESQQKAYGESWEAKSGKRIHWVDYNGGLGEVRAQIEAGEVRWDVVDVFAHEARLGCDEGLFERLPSDVFVPAPDGTPMDRDLTVPRPNDCVAPNIIWSWVTFYDTTRFPGEKPDALEDFFDLDRFPGKRGISAFPQATIEMALVADGVDPRRVYQVMDSPGGIDRAFAKLDTIRHQAVFWSSGAEPIDLVKRGEVALSTGYNGRVGAAVLADGAPFVTIWDGQVLDVEWFVMVKGSDHYDTALDFLIHASAPARLAAQAKWITYGPMRHSALAIIEAGEPWFHSGAEVMPHMPNRDAVMTRTVIAEPGWWAENGAAITERYTAWMDR